MKTLLFILYTTPLGFIISSYDLDLHLYTDNTEIYIFLLDQFQTLRAL